MSSGNGSVSIGSERRGVFLGYLSLFGSVSTLLCCALPSLLVLFGLGASVASALSFMPWLVSLSRHKIVVFGIAGSLIALSLVNSYLIAPRYRADACDPADPSCGRASRLSAIVLWVSASLYAIGFLTAFVLGPVIGWIDRS